MQTAGGRKVKKHIAALCVLAAGILWGSMGVFVDLLGAFGFTTLQTAFLRIGSAAVLFVVFLLFKDKNLLRIGLRDIPVLFGLGIGCILAMTCVYFLAIRATNYSTAAILLYTAPVMVSVMAAVFFKERFTRRKVIALAAAFIGCVLVSGLDPQSGVSPQGVLLGLLSGFAYAMYSILCKIALRRLKPETVSTYAFVFALFGALFACDVPGMAGHFSAAFAASPVPLLLAVLGIGLVTAFLPFLLYSIGLSGLPAGKASILASVEPLVATLFGLLRGQGLRPEAALGIVCILGAVVLLTTEKAD